jgi:methionyl aminopeptidase
MTTEELDRQLHEFIVAHDCYPSPLNYRGFPKSVCTSVNNVICHGIPDSRPLEDGDIVNVDLTVFTRAGVHSDTSNTFLVGSVDAPGRELVQAASDCLMMAIEACGPGQPLNKIGAAIQCAEAVPGAGTAAAAADAPGRRQEARRLEGVQRFPDDVCTRHQPRIPQRAHHPAVLCDQRGPAALASAHAVSPPQTTATGDAWSRAWSSLWVCRGGVRARGRPGSAGAGRSRGAEPIVSQGSSEGVVWPDEWTVATVDGGRSAQAEHTILITETGVEILTA